MQLTLEARSAPFSPGHFFIIEINSIIFLSVIFSFTIIPFIDPLFLTRDVIVLVSIPWIPTIFFLINQLFKSKSDLKFEGLVILALIITPLAKGISDSLSIMFVPVLPI